MLQHHLSTLPLTGPSKDDIGAGKSRPNLDFTNEAAFIPRKVFLQAVKDRYGDGAPEHEIIMEFIESVGTISSPHYALKRN